MKFLRYSVLLLFTAVLLSACTKSKNNVSQDQNLNNAHNLDLPGENEDTLAQSGLSFNNLNLSGEKDPDLSGITPPSLNFGNSAPADSTGQGAVIVASGRLIPIADKEGKSVAGWRVVGEVFNGKQELFNNGQLFVEIKIKELARTLLPDPVQPGGFVPIKPQERGVYDLIINEPITAEQVSIGVRNLDQKNERVRIEAENVSFVRRGEQYLVRGRVTNNQNKPVVDLIVRFWGVTSREEVPEGAKTADQVVAVGTWRASQDVLNAGQSRDFEAQLSPLTGADQEEMTANDPQLSAIAAAKVLE